MKDLFSFIISSLFTYNLLLRTRKMIVSIEAYALVLYSISLLSLLLWNSLYPSVHFQQIFDQISMKFDTQSLDSFHFYLNCFTVNESESIKNRGYNNINFYNRTKKIWTFCTQYFISYRKWILKWINFYFLTFFVIVNWVRQIITILSIVGFLFLMKCLCLNLLYIPNIRTFAKVKICYCTFAFRNFYISKGYISCRTRISKNWKLKLTLKLIYSGQFSIPWLIFFEFF